MKKVPNVSKWGTETARKRYADGGAVDRRAGRVRLREAMGGEPAVFGPVQRAIFGDKFPLHGRDADSVQVDQARQMRQSEEISDAVPRKRGE